jgi:hypothetical protein
LDSLNKITLIKIINLYEELTEKDIINDINKKYNEEINNFKKEIIKIKLNSIKSDLNKKQYKEKTIVGIFSLYYYENKSIKIYKKDIKKSENIIKILKENKNWKVSFVKNKNNTHILVKDIEYEEFIKIKELISSTN